MCLKLQWVYFVADSVYSFFSAVGLHGGRYAYNSVKPAAPLPPFLLHSLCYSFWDACIVSVAEWTHIITSFYWRHQKVMADENGSFCGNFTVRIHFQGFAHDIPFLILTRFLSLFLFIVFYFIFFYLLGSFHLSLRQCKRAIHLSIFLLFSIVSFCQLKLIELDNNFSLYTFLFYSYALLWVCVCVCAI